MLAAKTEKLFSSCDSTV